MARYKETMIVRNDIEFYDFLRKSKGISSVRHYNTAYLYHPDAADRATVATSGHVWKYGDRFYKLAQKYYSNPEHWWVIAWWNGVPTEADITNGSIIDIPINLEDALLVLGAY
tara:strand:+ start:1214 stop:1552 length:339 start_codon:yes stop_codon:yes gene_type:complete